MDREQRFVKDLAGICTLCEMVKIYYINSIKGTRFRNPRISSKADKIKEFAHSIQSKELKGYVKMRSEWVEEFEDEHALALFRVFDQLLFAPTDEINRIADELEGN